MPAQFNRIHSTTYQHLLQTYNELPADEQRILQVLSVLYKPVNQTTIKKILGHLRWKTESGNTLASLMAKPLKERLLERGLLEKEGNYLVCARTIAEPLTRETLTSGLFEEIADATARVVPLEPPRHGYWYYSYDPDNEQRKLRLAIYRGDIKKSLKLLGGGELYQPLESEQAQPLIDICANPLEPEWFSTQPQPLQYQVLYPLLTRAAFKLENKKSLHKLTEQIFIDAVAKQPEIAALLIEQRLLRGDGKEIETLFAQHQSSQIMALRGWFHFLQRRDPEALECFTAALKAHRAAMRKRNIPLSGFAGFFHLLTLLGSGGKTNLDQAKKLIWMGEKRGASGPLLSSENILKECLSVLYGESTLEVFLANATRLSHNTPWNNLTNALVTFWLGGKPTKKLIHNLKRHRIQAIKGGWNWFATESALLLREFDPEMDEEPAELPGIHPITTLIKPEAPWERTLRILREIPQKGAADGTTTDNKQMVRMAWWLDLGPDHYTLVPKEQKITKSGAWSKGRNVALRRLYETPDEFDYLTPQDRKICQQIRVETDYESWGRYDSNYYDLSSEAALLAAVDHPLLFRADAPEHRVELTTGDPVLEVHTTKNGLLLKLSPPPADNGATLVISDEGPDRLRLIQFTGQHIQIGNLLGSDGLKVPESAKEQVLSTISAIAPLLSVHSDIGSGEQSHAESVTADPRLHLHLQPAGDGLQLECYVNPFGEGGPLFHPGAGSSILIAEVAGKTLQTYRDLSQESARAEELFSYCPSLLPDEGWRWQLDEPEVALETLYQLQELDDRIVLEWPQGRNIRLSRTTDETKVQLSIRKQRDWFDLSGGLQLEHGEVLALARLLELLEQSPGRFIKLGEGEFLTLTDQLHRRLDTLRAISTHGAFHPLTAPLLDEVTEGMMVKRGKAWRDQLRRIREANDLHPEIPSTLKAELREYQIEGFQWLMRLTHWGAGACLADDMGLGKTLQALTLILSHAPKGPTLVLAPTSVCMNWLNEAQRFTPTLNPVQFGSGDRQKMLDQAGPFDLIVCSYGLLHSESMRLAEVAWQTVVADEAQAIKNALTKRSKAAMELKAEHKIITTGTPIENHLGELWNLFRFINPGLLGSQEHFNRRFAFPIENNNDHKSKQQLKRLIHPFILRRLKSDVLNELPPKTEITLQVELGDEEKALYEALRIKAMERLAEPVDNPGQQRVKMLAEIMRLRRACCNPKLVLPESTISSAKLQAFVDIVKELRENRHKVLVFSQFVGHLTLIREQLDKLGIHYQYLDGSTTAKKRKLAVDAFQAGEGDLFLISLKAGGSGLNLTAADYVIHMDPWWNPAVEDQASDRSHRIGQQRPVTIYRLVAKDTIEEKIVDLHQHKRDLADSLLEGSDMSGPIEVEEIMALIQDSA